MRENLRWLRDVARRYTAFVLFLETPTLAVFTLPLLMVSLSARTAARMHYGGPPAVAFLLWIAAFSVVALGLYMMFRLKNWSLRRDDYLSAWSVTGVALFQIAWTLILATTVSIVDISNPGRRPSQRFTAIAAGSVLTLFVLAGFALTRCLQDEPDDS